MDRLSSQIRKLHSAGIHPGPAHGPTDLEGQNAQYIRDRALIDTSIATARMSKQLDRMNVLMIFIAVMSMITAASTFFLAFALYRLLVAVSEASDQLNTTF